MAQEVNRVTSLDVSPRRIDILSALLMSNLAELSRTLRDDPGNEAVINVEVGKIFDSLPEEYRREIKEEQAFKTKLALAIREFHTLSLIHI